jgi:GT2 family glycosyltransferase
VPPSLSVVIPTHRRTDLLRACLRSVVRNAPSGTEILVVDDGSVGANAANVVAEFPPVSCLRLSGKKGFACAANAGLRIARGTVVEILNDDTEVTPGWAEAALAVFDDPQVAAVAPLVLYHPTTDLSLRHATPILDSAGDRYYQGGIAQKRGHGRALGKTFLKPCPVFGASASSAFFRRSVLLEVGDFPETFGAYFEDVDLAFRLHRAGWAVRFEPASRVYHHVGGSYAAKSRALVELQSRNEERVFWRNVPGRVLPRVLPVHLAVLAAKAWRRWEEGTLFPFLLGRLRVLTELADLRKHRQALQARYPAEDWTAWHVDSQYRESEDGEASQGRQEKCAPVTV